MQEPITTAPVRLTLEEMEKFNARVDRYVIYHYCGLSTKVVRRYFLEHFTHLQAAYRVFGNHDSFTNYKAYFYKEQCHMDESAVYLFVISLFDRLELTCGRDFYLRDVFTVWREAADLISWNLDTEYTDKDFERDKSRVLAAIKGSQG